MFVSSSGCDAGWSFPSSLVRRFDLSNCPIQRFGQLRGHVGTKPGYLCTFERTECRRGHSNGFRELRLRQTRKNAQIPKVPVVLGHDHKIADRNTHNCCDFQQGVHLRCRASRFPRVDRSDADVSRPRKVCARGKPCPFAAADELVAREPSQYAPAHWHRALSYLTIHNFARLPWM